LQELLTPFQRADSKRTLKMRLSIVSRAEIAGGQ